MSKLNEVVNHYEEKYNSKPIAVRSPGRINLIGEHTDYNDGFVFPAAIDKEIYLAIGENDTNEIHLHSIDFNDSLSIRLDEVKPVEKQWANYLLGVVNQFIQKNIEIKGFQCVFGGNIPIGAGLSSSAALENALAFGLNKLFNCGKDRDELALMGQQAEHTYVGTKCGIMDQFTSMNGEKDHALLLDCRSLEYKLYPIQLKDYQLILVDTEVKHELASSEYNTRRKECETAVEHISKENPKVKSLRDIKLGTLEEYRLDLDYTVYKRSFYVINEITRTLAAAQALTESNIDLLGELMHNTHIGLRDNYAVSCKELDFLVDEAMSSGFVKGSRMMGGGFGGCTINLVKNENIEEFKKIISSKYEEKFRVKPSIYEVNIVDGTSVVDL